MKTMTRIAITVAAATMTACVGAEHEAPETLSAPLSVERPDGRVAVTDTFETAAPLDEDALVGETSQGRRIELDYRSAATRHPADAARPIDRSAVAYLTPLNKIEEEVIGAWIVQGQGGDAQVVIFAADRTACTFRLKGGQASPASTERWQGWWVDEHLGFDGTHNSFILGLRGERAPNEVMYNSHTTDPTLSSISINGMIATPNATHTACPR